MAISIELLCYRVLVDSNNLVCYIKYAMYMTFAGIIFIAYYDVVR